MMTNGTYRVLADLDLCQGHQNCLLDAPDVFGFDDGADRVEVLNEHPSEDHRVAVQAAVQYCPAMALRVEEETP